MNHTRMAKILFFSVAGIIFSVIAMEKEVVRQRFAPKKISANQQQEGKGKMAQKKLSKKEVEKKKQEEEESRILEKKAQEIAETDTFKLSVEKVKTPKYFTIDYEDTDNVVFEDVLPVSTQKSTRRPVVHVATPMISAKRISHTNPMQLSVAVTGYVQNKEIAKLNRILNDPTFVQQLKAFKPYNPVENVENVESFNKAMISVQEQIAEKEQGITRKKQIPKANTNG